MAHVCAVRQFPYDTHLSREVNALLHAGHDVEVVCMSRPGEPRRERRGRLTIWRLPIRHRRGGGRRYVAEHAAFVLLATAWVALRHARDRFDLVQVNSPPDSVVVCALVPKLLGTPVLLDLVECTPEFFASRFGTSQRHPLVRLLAAVEQFAIRRADAAVTGTAQMKQRFVERGAPENRITVVLNSSDEHVFDPSRVTAPRKSDGTFTLLCHGTIEHRYGLDVAIQAVALLRDEIPGLRFEILGEGSERPTLEQLTRSLGVEDRVHFGGHVPVDRLVEALGRADAGVVPVRRDPFRDLTHTNKMFDFVAMRRPAIASWTRAVADYFPDEALQYFASEDPEDLARAIREVHGDPDRRRRMVEMASTLYADYRWPRQRDRYLAVVDRLLSRED